MFANDGYIHFKMTGSSHTAHFNFFFISSNPRTWTPDTTVPPNVLAATYLRPEYETQRTVRAAQPSGAIRPAQNEFCTYY